MHPQTGKPFLTWDVLHEPLGGGQKVESSLKLPCFLLRELKVKNLTENFKGFGIL